MGKKEFKQVFITPEQENKDEKTITVVLLVYLHPDHPYQLPTLV